jgi:hypothetical protein
LSDRIITRPSTGCLKMPVVTGFPFQSTSRGTPTQTEISLIGQPLQ